MKVLCIITIEKTKVFTAFFLFVFVFLSSLLVVSSLFFFVFFCFVNFGVVWVFFFFGLICVIQVTSKSLHLLVFIKIIYKFVHIKNKLLSILSTITNITHQRS